MADTPPDTPAPGPKQQPDDPGDTTAVRGSAAANGYWLHDDAGPRAYVPVNPTDGAPSPDAGLERALALVAAADPALAPGAVTLAEEGGALHVRGQVPDAGCAAAVLAAVQGVAGGRAVVDRLEIKRKE